MSRFIPAKLVVRESLHQLKRRLSIEAAHKQSIAGLKKQIEDGEDIVSELTALGFTDKHAKVLKWKLENEIANDKRLNTLKESKEKREQESNKPTEGESNDKA